MRKLLLFILLLGSLAYSQNTARMLSGVNYQNGTSYLFAPSDTTKVVAFSNVAPVTATLSTPTVIGLGTGIVFTVNNLGLGTVTITCSGCTINSSSSLALATGAGADIYSDGTNYTAVTGASSLIIPPSSGLCLVSTGSTAGAYSWQSCTGSAATWSTLVPGSGTIGAGTFNVGTGSTMTTTGSGVINASTLGGATFASPGPIGSSAASTGAFTTLSASSTVSGSGFSAYLASPPAIGGTAASTLKGTTINATTGFQINGTAPSSHCLIGNGTNYVDSSSCGGGGSGTVTSIGLTQTGTLFTITNSPVTTAGAININFTGILPVANGGTGTSSPSLVAGTNVTITGSWPNQTVNSTASGSGTVTSSGSPTSGNIPKFTTATNIAPAAASDIVNLFSTCSGTQYLGADGACHSSSGTINPATQYSLTYYSAAGTANTIDGLTAPTNPNGVPQIAVSIPVGGAATAPQNALPGVAGRVVSTSSDTIASTDCNPQRIEYTYSGAVTESVPTPTTLGVPNCTFKLVIPSNSSTTSVTVSTTPWTVNGSGSLTLIGGQTAMFFIDPNSASNWQADLQPTSDCGIVDSLAYYTTANVNLVGCDTLITTDTSGDLSAQNLASAEQVSAGSTSLTALACPSGVTGAWCATEGSTAGTPTAGVDYIRADATTHTFKYSLNGAGEATFPNGIGFPVTVSGTVTNGGVPFFSGPTTESTSALLAVNALMVGGGVGAAPATGNADFTYTTDTLAGGASGLVDFSAMSGADAFKQPVKAGLTVGSNGSIGFDSTNKQVHIFNNGVDSIVGALPVSITPVNNDCVKWTKVSNTYYLNTAGAACGSGGGGGTNNGAAGSSGTAIVLTGTSYAPIFGNYSSIITTEANGDQTIGSIGQVIANLQVVLGTALGGGQTLTVTLRDTTAAADEAVTCQVAASGTSCADTTHSYSVPTGHLITWKMVLSSTTATTNVNIGAVVGAASTFSGNTSTAVSATSGVSGAAANTLLTADGSGNAQPSTGLLTTSLGRNLYTEVYATSNATNSASSTAVGMFTGYTIPASTLTAGHRIVATACFKHSTGSTTTVYAWYINGTAATSYGAFAGVAAYCQTLQFVAVDSTHQQAIVSANTSSALGVIQNATAYTLTNSNTINMTQSAAGTADVYSGYTFTVDLY